METVILSQQDSDCYRVIAVFTLIGLLKKNFWATMKGSSYEMVDFAVEANHVAAGRKRVKNWLLDTTVGEIRSPTRFAIKSFDDTNFVKFAMKGMDEGS